MKTEWTILDWKKWDFKPIFLKSVAFSTREINLKVYERKPINGTVVFWRKLIGGKCITKLERKYDSDTKTFSLTIVHSQESGWICAMLLAPP